MILFSLSGKGDSVRIYGRKILKEALENDIPIRKVYFAQLERPSTDFLKLIELVEGKGIPYKFVSKEKADNLVHGEKSQGVVIELDGFPYFSLEDALGISANTERLVILLDQIQDPHNFGAIVRSAVGAGVDFVVIPKNNSVKVTPAVVKVSAGTIFKIPIVMVTNLARTIERLKDEGFWIYAASMGGTPYYKVDVSGDIGVVFGNEGKGIRRLIVEKCDGIVSIPMRRNIDSLNVAVSAGIIMYDIIRRRENK